MAYQLKIIVTDVSFGTTAGVARSNFDAEQDTLRIEIDMTRMSSNSQFGALIAHEVAHHVHGLHPRIANAGPLYDALRGTGNPSTQEQVMNKPITLFDRVLDALQSCEGVLSSYVEGNATPDMMACVAIRNHAQAIIAEATKANTLLPVPGNDPFPPPERSQAEVIDAILAPPKTRTYSVMVRRPCQAFANVYVEAASVEEALDLGRRKAREHTGAYECDDMGEIDWAHAELGDGEDEPDGDAAVHADWEQPKLSPGKLMATLHTIVSRANVASGLSKTQMLATLQYIENIARCAIDESVPGHD